MCSLSVGALPSASLGLAARPQVPFVISRGPAARQQQQQQVQRRVAAAAAASDSEALARPTPRIHTDATAIIGNTPMVRWSLSGMNLVLEACLPAVQSVVPSKF